MRFADWQFTLNSPRPADRPRTGSLRKGRRPRAVWGTIAGAAVCGALYGWYAAALDRRLAHTGVETAPMLSITEPGTYHLEATAARRALAVTVDGRDTNEPWPEDHFLIRVNSPDGSRIVERTFESTYGAFGIDLIDLTGDGIEEFVFTLGQGRGTSARSERLIVEQLRGSSFATILDIPLSEYYGAGEMWRYKPQYIRTGPHLTTDLRLILEYGSPGASGLESPELIPSTDVADYHWEPARNALVLCGTACRPHADVWLARVRNAFR